MTQFFLKNCYTIGFLKKLICITANRKKCQQTLIAVRFVPYQIFSSYFGWILYM